MTIDYPASKESPVLISLAEFPGRQFSFDQAAKTSTSLSNLQSGDSLTILALKSHLEENETVIHAYELHTPGYIIFSLDQYNERKMEQEGLMKTLIFIIIFLSGVYFLFEMSGLSKWIYQKLSSGNKQVEPQDLNFNEYLDR